ncbi:MAG TPA: S9 family peptidase [Candidatus Marinimicrobia bacterium]|nr:S9 family peptidase [Candidatus Neomarinimicrobiota bacterium]
MKGVSTISSLNRFLRLIVSVIFILCSCTPPASNLDSSVASYPIIPLKTLLAQPSFNAPQISPDGTMVAFIAPLEGIPNLFVAPIHNLDSRKPLTHYNDRGIQARDVSGIVMYKWSSDNQFLLYPRDYNGDENWDIYSVNVETGKGNNLTPSPGVRVSILGQSRRNFDKVIISMNDRIPPLPDLYTLNIKTGEKQLVEFNDDGFVAYVVDNDLKPRVALKLTSGGSMALYRSIGDGTWSHFFDVTSEDVPAIKSSSYQKIVHIDKTNTKLYAYDSRKRNTNALIEFDLETDENRVVAVDENVDIGGVLYDPSSHKPQAYAVNWTMKHWVAIDPLIGADLQFLGDRTEGEFEIISQSNDNQKWVVQFMESDSPITFHIFDRREKQLTKMFTSTPQLEGLSLAKMHPYVMKSRDGFDLVSYVVLPFGTDPDNNGRPIKPLPTIMIVHGGPSDERATYAFGPFVQWLANRGYAVLYVNFRGSPGFGKSFMNAQRLEWGGKMHDDLIDQVNWAVAEGVAQKDKIAIMGGSYGGYATLVGMTMTPDIFACGVEIVGPSSLETFMPHWDVDQMATIVGDPRTEDGRKLLQARSPINFAHQTINPILIGQGKNDSRVPQVQSDNMVEKMVENGAKVTYVVFPDEGHGFNRQENIFAFWGITELFLAKYLGGRAEPIGDKLEGSSASIPVGINHIRGLKKSVKTPKE